jgi:hypothetical protein
VSVSAAGRQFGDPERAELLLTVQSPGVPVQGCRPVPDPVLGDLRRYPRAEKFGKRGAVGNNARWFVSGKLGRNAPLTSDTVSEILGR